MPDSLKSATFRVARAQLTGARARLVDQLAALDAARAADTKSSAGDKYETSREAPRPGARPTLGASSSPPANN